MARFQALPDDLFSGSHSRATLLRAGVSRRELAGPLWESPNRGLYAWGGGASLADSAPERARRAAGGLPAGAAIGGWAAAVLLGEPRLAGLTYDRAEDELVPAPVLVCLQPDQRTIRRRGLRVIHSLLGPDDVIEVDGVLVTSPLRTSFDLARLTKDEDRALAAVDALHAHCAIDASEAAEYVRRHRGWVGTPQARRVYGLVDPASLSEPESRLRWLWVHEAGMPRPLVNRELEGPGGVFLGMVDLLDTTSGVVGEYDGALHSGAEKRGTDHHREESLERAKLTVLRFTAPDLTRLRARTITRIRRAHATGLTRDRTQDRWSLRPPSAN